MNEPLATGAHPSPYDPTVSTHVTATPPVATGGIIYDAGDIEMQSKVGICTAISVVQNAEKVNGKKYSPDFHWLLQKTLFDHNWYEGSSILNSLKVAKTYGFLPANEWTHTTSEDRNDYQTYITKLQSIPSAEVKRLMALCSDRIVGFASTQTDSQSVASGIQDSKAGVIVMLTSGSTWWTALNGTNSWASADIDPIRVPTTSLSGHAINLTYFDYRVMSITTGANTWSPQWDENGNCHINLDIYKLWEVWIPYYTIEQMQLSEIGFMTKLVALLKQLLGLKK